LRAAGIPMGAFLQTQRMIARSRLANMR
jgi:hypothetical protein